MEFGIVTLVRLLHSENALFPIDITPSGIITSPPSPLYFISTPSSITKSPSPANTVVPTKLLGTNIASIVIISTNEITFFSMSIT